MKFELDMVTMSNRTTYEGWCACTLPRHYSTCYNVAFGLNFIFFFKN